MTLASHSPKIAVVTGDLTIDWNLARSRREKGNGSAWNADDSTRAYWQRGGAALLADLITAVARENVEAGRSAWNVRGIGAPTENVCPEDLPYHHSYAIWSNRAPQDETPIWRVEEFLGLDPSTAHGTAAGNEWNRVVGDTPDAELVILDDAALGFREDRALWPQAILAGDRRPWVITKMARPVAKGALWEHLCRHHSDRLIVVMTVNDLRRTEVQISRELSWERTAQDLAWELVHNPKVNGLFRCASVVISFETAGAFLMWGGRAGEECPDAASRCSLFFDPKVIEGMWAQAYPGGMIGYTTCLTAGIARQVMLSPEQPDLPQGIQSGLAAMRALHIRGYSQDGAMAPLANLRFPTAAIVAELGRAHAPFSVADVQNPVRFLTGEPAAETPPDGRFWSILHDRYTENLSGVAEQIVLHGPESALQGVPLGEFGKLLTVDRREIESFRSIRALVHEYWRRGRQKPLSIAVFGAPGSGKSFGIIEVASSLLPKQIEVRQFNLSQFGGPDDLHDALHQVRDVGLSGVIPLVFWDEFDTALDRQRLGWLRHFLAPMQDGTFQQGQITHPIGRAIFVFAGGTSETYEGFVRQIHEEEVKAAKGPDFASRLKGYVNILGPNRQASNAGADSTYIIRRGILLRSILKRDTSQLFRWENGHERLNIDGGVLRAFLETRNYRHGVRSMESIVAMSALVGKTGYERSSLPSGEQLELHVDAQDFLALVQQMDLGGDLLDRLARAAHEVYCAGKERDGWRYGPTKSEANKTHPLLIPYDDLPEIYKESNRVTVRTIPRKLAAAGYVMMPARSNDPPFAFPGGDLEKLARLEHDLWMEVKLADGWRQGSPTRDDPKRNEYLVDWQLVPDQVKQIDRDLIKGIPQILSRAGYAVVKSRQPGVGEVETV